MDVVFNNVEDLYKRVKPALRSKVRELNRKNVSYVKEEDIWNFLIEDRWKKTKGLELNEIVDDILNVDNSRVMSYVQVKMGNFKRDVNLKNTTIL